MFYEGIAWFLFLLVPSYCLKRIWACGPFSMYNITIYPLIFSYFYMLVPMLIDAETGLNLILNLTDDSLREVNKISIWYVALFFINYYLSKEKNLAVEIFVSEERYYYLVLRLIQCAAFLIIFYIMIKYGPDLYALSGDRAASYDYFSKNIADNYKLPVVFSFLIVSSQILYIKNKSIINLLSVVPFIVVDALQGGRGYTFSALIYIFVNLILFSGVNYRALIVAAVLLISGLFASAYVRRFLSSNDDVDPLVAMFGEFIYTRITAQYTLDNLSMNSDVVTYFVLTLSKLIPQFIASKFISADILVPYATILNDWAGVGFGLAGSVISESIYYGGLWFAYVSPLIISMVMSSINNSKQLNKLHGYIFFILMATSMPIFFRSGFYLNFSSLIYVMIYYFSILIYPTLSWKIFKEH